MATAEAGQRGSSGRAMGEEAGGYTQEAVHGAGAESGGEEAMEFNLSDADALANQLERVELTEEESDKLMEEALKVNKQLRKMLKQKQDKTAASMRAQSAGSNVSGRLRVLPPIKKSKGDTSPESKRAYGQTLTKSVSQSKPRAQSVKTKAVSKRPQWDDRFSFS